MPLCRTIAILAGQLESQFTGMQESHCNMIAVMKNMPFYLEKGDLSAWETDYRVAIGESENESSRTYMAIDLVYELAGLNLFGAFQLPETGHVYKQVTSELKKLGLNVSEDLDVSQW